VLHHPGAQRGDELAGRQPGLPAGDLVEQLAEVDVAALGHELVLGVARGHGHVRDHLADPPARTQRGGIHCASLAESSRSASAMLRAIQGKGAFRRFEDELNEEYPDLLPAWYAYRDVRAKRRAVPWLADNSLIDDEAADRFLTGHPDPDLP